VKREREGGGSAERSKVCVWTKSNVPRRDARRRRRRGRRPKSERANNKQHRLARNNKQNDNKLSPPPPPPPLPPSPSPSPSQVSKSPTSLLRHPRAKPPAQHVVVVSGDAHTGPSSGICRRRAVLCHVCWEYRAGQGRAWCGAVCCCAETGRGRVSEVGVSKVRPYVPGRTV
jgi:hypothetical protein